MRNRIGGRPQIAFKYLWELCNVIIIRLSIYFWFNCDFKKNGYVEVIYRCILFSFYIMIFRKFVISLKRVGRDRYTFHEVAKIQSSRV